jgi:hypothetical protein
MRIGELVEANRRLEARVAELEQRLNRSSRNSSLPPSQDPPSAPPRPRPPGSGRTRGGQPGQEGRHRRLLLTATRHTVCSPTNLAAQLVGADVVKLPLAGTTCSAAISLGRSCAGFARSRHESSGSGAVSSSTRSTTRATATTTRDGGSWVSCGRRRSSCEGPRCRQPRHRETGPRSADPGDLPFPQWGNAGIPQISGSTEAPSSVASSSNIGLDPCEGRDRNVESCNGPSRSERDDRRVGGRQRSRLRAKATAPAAPRLCLSMIALPLLTRERCWRRCCRPLLRRRARRGKAHRARAV